MASLTFADPHPLGLPSGRYSHPLRLLGTGSFGKVYLCCLRIEVPQPPQPPASAAATAAPSGDTAAALYGASCSSSHGVRPMSLDLDDSNHHNNNGHGQGGGQQEQLGASNAGSAHAVNGGQHFPDTAHEGRSDHQQQQQQQQESLQPVYEHQWVAVKVFKLLVQCDMRSLEYLKREVVCQRRLQHQHVIGFREVGITSGEMRLYLALEYANGGNLKQLLAQRGGRLAEPVARWFTQQLVYGLAYCHAHGVFNRDIKPENLLLDHGSGLEQPLLKVADFGLAKSSLDSAPNSCVGSPNFMAPEVFTSRVYDGRKADVFSCGVVLYQLVFGGLPFHRTLDGRQLDFKHHMRDILRNMKAEAWPNLIPTAPAFGAGAAPACAAAGGGGAGGAQPLVQPSAGLMDLLTGMLRYDPAQRLSLYDVKRHPWYREGLSDEVYAMLLEEDADAAAAGWHGAGQQSVEVIEAEFVRILEHTAALHREAARRAVDNEFEVE